MPKELQSAEEFSLDSVIITTERLGGLTFDITNITTEINIYENIYIPYLTGSLMIVDDNDLNSIINFQGTEKLIVTLSAPGTSDKPLEKTFIITKIDSSVNQNDYTKVIAFTITEDVLFYNNVQSVSKLYEGTGEEIIEKVLSDKLGKQLAGIARSTSFQGSFRILTPYLSPFNITNMVLEKITTENGSPFFLYSTMYSDDLFLTDLDTINSSDPITNDPFVYSQSVANEPDNDLMKQALSIIYVKADNREDTMLLAELGAISSLYNITDMSDGEFLQTPFNINELMGQLEGQGIISSNQNIPLVDNTFIPDQTGNDNRTIAEYYSKRFHQVAGGKTYPYEPQINNWTAENDPFSYKLRLNAYVQKQLLFKNTLDVMLPGILFMSAQSTMSVGRTIDLITFKSEIDTSNVAQRDNKLSGRFIIMSKRHIFNCAEFRHTVSLSCSRITDERPQA